MLKVVALLTMLIDHIGLIFFPQFFIFRIIGRLAFPLFAFGIATGYSYTKDVKKYGQRIFLLALVSQPIFYFAISPDYLNICFTLLFGLIAIYFYDKNSGWFLKIALPLLLALGAQLVGAEYGAFGVLMILFFFIFKNWKHLFLSQCLLIFSYILVFPSNTLVIFAILGVIMAIFEVKLRKYKIHIKRAIYYAFYPAHLLLLYLIQRLSLVIL